MLLEDIRTYLVDNGVVWPVYIGFMPDDVGQDQAIGLFETGGFPPDTLLRENEDTTFLSRVRGSKGTYSTVRAKWATVYNLLQDTYATGGYLSGVVFIQAMHQGPATFTDSNGRPNFTSNWRVKKVR